MLGSGKVGLLTALAARLRGLELTVFSLPTRPYRNADLVTPELRHVSETSQIQGRTEQGFSVCRVNR